MTIVRGPAKALAAIGLATATAAAALGGWNRPGRRPGGRAPGDRGAGYRAGGRIPRHRLRHGPAARPVRGVRPVRRRRRRGLRRLRLRQLRGSHRRRVRQRHLRDGRRRRHGRRGLRQRRGARLPPGRRVRDPRLLRLRGRPGLRTDRGPPRLCARRAAGPTPHGDGGSQRGARGRPRGHGDRRGPRVGGRRRRHPVQGRPHRTGRLRLQLVHLLRGRRRPDGDRPAPGDRPHRDGQRRRRLPAARGMRRGRHQRQRPQHPQDGHRPTRLRPRRRGRPAGGDDHARQRPGRRPDRDRHRDRVHLQLRPARGVPAGRRHLPVRVRRLQQQRRPRRSLHPGRGPRRHPRRWLRRARQRRLRLPHQRGAVRAGRHQRSGQLAPRRPDPAPFPARRPAPAGTQPDRHSLDGPARPGLPDGHRHGLPGAGVRHGERLPHGRRRLRSGDRDPGRRRQRRDDLAHARRSRHLHDRGRRGGRLPGRPRLRGPGHLLRRRRPSPAGVGAARVRPGHGVRADPLPRPGVRGRRGDRGRRLPDHDWRGRPAGHADRRHLPAGGGHRGAAARAGVAAGRLVRRPRRRCRSGLRRGVRPPGLRRGGHGLPAAPGAQLLPVPRRARPHRRLPRRPPGRGRGCRLAARPTRPTTGSTRGPSPRPGARPGPPPPSTWPTCPARWA